MIPTITAFESSPDRGRGLARDTRVRWALEEVGQAYDVRLVSFAAMKEPAHKAIQPFGQIPTYEDGEVTLFETGAIVLYIAEQHEALLPREPKARAHAIAWMFAALNTVEPPILERQNAMLLERDKPWTPERLVAIDKLIRVRLKDLSDSLGDSEWLEGSFSVGDVMMVHTLQRLKAATQIVDEYPNLAAYLARAEARPAYRRAFAAQLAVFTAAHPNQ